MQVRIQSNAKDEIGKMQREHYLREQMRVIKSELGDSDGKEEIDQFWQKMEELPLNKEAKEELSRQLKRLERMHQDTSEAALTRTHIETLLALPWGKKACDNLDLHRSKEILDKDHFGLHQVKDRIIEYLAVKKLNPEAKSPIICFVGPPGVGKTSFVRDFAEILGLKLITVEKPHLVEEHIINIPFIVFDKGSESKKDLKERLGRSPDFADAIMMRMWFELKVDNYQVIW
jgi:ATP-dependent Lon protease